MIDGDGLDGAVLGPAGFRVLEVDEVPEEVVDTIETTADFVGCSTCGTRVQAQDRKRWRCGDLPRFGRPAGWCGSSAGGGAVSRRAR